MTLTELLGTTSWTCKGRIVRLTNHKGRRFRLNLSTVLTICTLWQRCYSNRTWTFIVGRRRSYLVRETPREIRQLARKGGGNDGR